MEVKNKKYTFENLSLEEDPLILKYLFLLLTNNIRPLQASYNKKPYPVKKNIFSLNKVQKQKFEK